MSNPRWRSVNRGFGKDSTLEQFSAVDIAQGFTTASGDCRDLCRGCVQLASCPRPKRFGDTVSAGRNILHPGRGNGLGGRTSLLGDGDTVFGDAMAAVEFIWEQQANSHSLRVGVDARYATSSKTVAGFPAPVHARFWVSLPLLAANVGG